MTHIGSTRSDQILWLVLTCAICIGGLKNLKFPCEITILLTIFHQHPRSLQYTCLSQKKRLCRVPQTLWLRQSCFFWLRQVYCNDLRCWRTYCKIRIKNFLLKLQFYYQHPSASENIAIFQKKRICRVPQTLWLQPRAQKWLFLQCSQMLMLMLGHKN